MTDEQKPITPEGVVWMVEHPADETGGPYWFSGLNEVGASIWSDDADQGVRFARQADAEKLMAGLQDNGEHLKATDHIFTERPLEDVVCQIAASMGPPK